MESDRESVDHLFRTIHAVEGTKLLSAFEQAKELHEAGVLDQAELLYRKSVDHDSDPFKSLNNLGTVLEDQGRLNEAIDAYQRGVELAPDVFILHYNLARSLQLAQRLNESFLVYLRALQLEPNSFEAHYNLGNLLMDQGRYESAVQAYRRALELDECIEVYSNLGSALFELEQFHDAASCYQDAIALKPDRMAEHYHLGRTFEAMCKFDDAIASYRTCLTLDPSASEVHAHMVMVLRSLHREHEVELAFQVWREKCPDDPIAEHMWAAQTRESVPCRASDAYIRAVFDQFATDYDRQLSRMDYRAPQLLTQALMREVVTPSAEFDVLDAGCGTGLCGPVLRPFSRRLVGVDLSMGMLEKARLRGCYDELIEQELTACLLRSEQSFDLICAADTLVFFGELESVASAIHGALRPGGYVVFNIDALPHDCPDQLQLNTNGTYCHASEYVTQVCDQVGLRVIWTDSLAVRTEATRPVMGHVILASKRK